MKLYYSPGACSFAPHIALEEIGIPATTVKVDLRTHMLPDGSDYYVANPKGYVPMLELDDGTKLTEVAVILQYLADRKPGTLAPAAGTIARYQQMEWLNFIATEIHKAYGPLWHHPTPEVRDATIARLSKRYAIVEAALTKAPYLGGAAFSAADAYLYTVTNWSHHLKVDLSAFPHVLGFMKRVSERPSVLAALNAERGVKAAA